MSLALYHSLIMTRILNVSIVISMNTQLSRSHTCEQVWLEKCNLLLSHNYKMFQQHKGMMILHS